MYSIHKQSFPLRQMLLKNDQIKRVAVVYTYYFILYPNINIKRFCCFYNVNKVEVCTMYTNRPGGF